jgi:sensor histidine kinase YesM
LIHPLVENAVKYGMQTSSLPLSIEVQAQAQENRLRLEVRNTGKWVAHEQNGYHPSRNGAGIGQ